MRVMFTVKIILFFIVFALLLFCTVLFFLHTIISFVDSFRSSAPFVPLCNRAIEKLVDEMNIDETSVVYDLGSGDARVLYHLVTAKKVGKYIGIERSPIPLLFSLYYKNLLRGKGYDFTIKRADIFKTSLKDATHIIMYLFPKINQLLLEKFEQELSKGTRVYVIDFKFDKKEAVEIIDLGSGLQKNELAKTLYIYEF